MSDLNFPLIVVERPHQSPAKAWIAEDALAIIAEADRRQQTQSPWSRDEFETLEDWTEVFGEEEEDWPVLTRNYESSVRLKASHFPMVMMDRNNGHLEIQSKSIAPSELEFSIEYIGDDLHGLNFLESREAAESLLSSRVHNIPYLSIETFVQILFPKNFAY